MPAQWRRLWRVMMSKVTVNMTVYPQEGGKYEETFEIDMELEKESNDG